MSTINNNTPLPTSESKLKPFITAPNPIEIVNAFVGMYYPMELYKFLQQMFIEYLKSYNGDGDENERRDICCKFETISDAIYSIEMHGLKDTPST